MPIRILVVDDHALLRKGIRLLISAESDMQLVAEGSTGREAVQEFRTYRPDITIMDLQMPDMSGVEAVDQSRAMTLAELALVFAREVLHERGGLLIKAFQGEGFEAFLREMRACFPAVVIRKPDASRSRSREVYLLGRLVRPMRPASRKKA